MLKTLHLQNFTAFEDAHFEFVPGLNVLVGANSTGKTHVLKAAYAMTRTTPTALKLRDASDRGEKMAQEFSRVYTGVASEQLAYSLIRSSLAQDQISLVKSSYANDFEAQFTLQNLEIWTQRQASHAGDHDFDLKTLNHYKEKEQLFIPAKDFFALIQTAEKFYQDNNVFVEGILFDIAEFVDRPQKRKESDIPFIDIAKKLTESIEGFSVDKRPSGIFEIFIPSRSLGAPVSLVADGYKKIALLVWLIKNNSISPGHTLYIDEPEAYLNPKLLKAMARALVEIAEGGCQVILATHSLFLLKEFHILQAELKAKVAYFSLQQENGATSVKAAQDIGALVEIPALSAELEQADRFEI